MKSAVIYTRVSTDRQAEKDLSLPTQLEICRRYASQNGYVALKEFQDAGESARSSDRPAFLEMIDYCLTNYRAHEIKAIICSDTSRFARNRYDALLFKKQLAKKGIRVHFATQNLSDGPEGELLEAFLEATDEFYSKNLARNIIRGMEENARRGYLNGSKPPLGYQIIKIPDAKGNLKGRLEVVEHEASVIRLIFHLYLSGLGYKSICDELDKRGIRTREGRRFPRNTIESLLKNRRYEGDLVFRKIVVKNVHPPIISREVFEKAQALGKERDPKKISGRELSSPLLFSGLLFCGNCGEKLTYERTFKPNKTYTYYSCSSFKRRRTECPSPIRFDVKRIDQYLLNKIFSRILTHKNLKNLLVQLERLRIKLLNDSRSRLNKLHYELNTVQRRIDNLLDAIADGTVHKEMVKDKLEKLNINKEAIEEDMTRGQIIPFPKLNPSDSFIERFKDICREMIMDGDPIKARTFLKKFIEKITLTRNACNVAYNLAGVVPTNEDCSSLKEGLVELNGIEPSAS